MIGRIVCWWKGKHLRGKFSRANDTHKFFKCPRCQRETKYLKDEHAAGVPA